MERKSAQVAAQRPDHALRYYMVACLDILGQKSKMAGLKMPRSVEEHKEAITILQQTAGEVIRLRESFDKYFFGASKRFASQLPTDKDRTMYNRYTQPETLHWSFSDTCVVAIPWMDDRIAASAAGLYRTIGTAAFLWLSGLATGHPIRGGIDVGVGLDITKGEVYGPALASAHHAESQVAKYPRIVVGHMFLELLKSIIHAEPRDRHKSDRDFQLWLASQYCKSAVDCLCQDSDGIFMIDCLKKNVVMPDQSMEKDAKALIAAAFDYVEVQLDIAEERGDDKLKQRYKTLKGYFDERWGK